MTKKEKAKDRYLQRTYGITLSEYDQKLSSQGESCALCRRHQSNFSTSLHVDHNHKTGKVRGLVCYPCNKFKIGRNNFRTAKALYDYMVEYEET